MDRKNNLDDPKCFKCKYYNRLLCICIKDRLSKHPILNSCALFKMKNDIKY